MAWMVSERVDPGLGENMPRLNGSSVSSTSRVPGIFTKSKKILVFFISFRLVGPNVSRNMVVSVL